MIDATRVGTGISKNAKIYSKSLAAPQLNQEEVEGPPLSLLQPAQSEADFDYPGVWWRGSGVKVALAHTTSLEQSRGGGYT